MSARTDVTLFIDATLYCSQARAPNHFHLMTTMIAEQTVGKLAAHAELKKNSPDVLVPFAEKFMGIDRKLSLK